MDKILVIDDCIAEGEALKSILETDYEVTVCHDTESGLDHALSGKYPFIILDMIKPDVDGFALLKLLQERIITKYIPVILVTDLLDIRHEEEALRQGAVDCIKKPVIPSILKARIHAQLRIYSKQLYYKNLAMIDELTGIGNRRRYEEEWRIKWREALRLGLPFSVCIFDIDKFKLYNDSFGHPAGDVVLANVAKTASSFLHRATDFVGRYGGEEFVAILVGNDARSAYEFLRVIRQAIEDQHIPHNSPVSPWITVSVGGVTVVPQSGDEYEKYLDIADSMLYTAKESGRNRVVWSDAGKEQWHEK